MVEPWSWLSTLVGAEAGGWKELREKEPRCEDPRESLKESRKSLVDFEGEMVSGEWCALESAGPFGPGSYRSGWAW